jgi:ribosomal protein L7/L12
MNKLIFIENEGYQARAAGKSFVRDNHYDSDTNELSHRAWRKGYLQAFKDSGGERVPSLGYLLRAVTDSDRADNFVKPTVEMTTMERAEKIRQIQSSISTLQDELKEHRRLLDESESLNTRNICIAMKKARRSVEAIKYYRDRHRTSLCEAKDYIDALTWD